MQDTAEDEGHHSPWELFASGTELCQAADEAPCLPAAITENVAEVVQGLMGLQRFAAYTELPDPAERWVAAGLGRPAPGSDQSVGVAYCRQGSVSPVKL